MQDLINSFVRLSAAMSIYSMQQMQSAVETIDPSDSVVKLKKMIDSMTDALTSQIDENKRKTIDSISNLGADVVTRTFDTLAVPSMSAKELVESTSHMMRKTSDQLSSMIRPERNEDKKESTSTPQAVEVVLATH